LGPSGFGGELLLTGAFVAAAAAVVVYTRGALAAERAGEPTVTDRAAALGGTIGPTAVAARPDNE
jgi:hypothetical protein